MKNEKTEKLATVPGSPSEAIALTADFGTVYVRRQPDGSILRPVKATMTLKERSGHIYRVAKKDTIAYSGYVYLNKIAAINVVTPVNVSVDGVNRPNPHIERDQIGNIRSVHVRKIGIGYNPTGNVTVVDKTLFFNTYTYFIQDVQAKMDRVVWKDRRPTDQREFPNCAVIGTVEDRPNENLVKGAKWVFFETTSPLGLWADYTNEAIVACLKEYTQRQRFADRIAQTIVTRNILADHPAIGIRTVEMNGRGEASVTVWGYRHELRPEDIRSIQSQAERGSESIEIKAETVPTEADEETAQVEAEVMADDEEMKKEFALQMQKETGQADKEKSK